MEVEGSLEQEAYKQTFNEEKILNFGMNYNILQIHLYLH